MKLGPHAILGTQAALDWARRTPIVKSLDRVDTLKQAQPGAITVFRCYFSDGEQAAMDVDATVNKILSELGGYKPTFVELFNEFSQRIAWGLENYLQFTWACVQRFHSIGQMVAGISNSTGQPEQDDVLYMANWTTPNGSKVPFAGIDAWAKHEYWGNQGFSTWNALRYRRDHALLSGQHPPIIITECGRDAVEGGLAGWKLDGISGVQYMNELLAYNAELEKDAYVIGATPFTAGPTPDWSNFDTDGDCWRIPGGVPGQISTGGNTMDDEIKAQIKQLLDQNAAITEALIALREGRFTGAGSVDGYIAALRGGSLPDGYNPTFPPVTSPNP